MPKTDAPGGPDADPSRLIAALPVATVAFDPAGRVVDANRRAEHLFGHPLGTLKGLPVHAALSATRLPDGMALGPDTCPVSACPIAIWC